MLLRVFNFHVVKLQLIILSAQFIVQVLIFVLALSNRQAIVFRRVRDLFLQAMDFASMYSV